MEPAVADVLAANVLTALATVASHRQLRTSSVCEHNARCTYGKNGRTAHLASLTGARAAQHWRTDVGSAISEPPSDASAALTSKPPPGAVETALKTGWHGCRSENARCKQEVNDASEPREQQPSSTANSSARHLRGGAKLMMQRE